MFWSKDVALVIVHIYVTEAWRCYAHLHNPSRIGVQCSATDLVFGPPNDPFALDHTGYLAFYIILMIKNASPLVSLYQ